MHGKHINKVPTVSFSNVNLSVVQRSQAVISTSLLKHDQQFWLIHLFERYIYIIHTNVYVNLLVVLMNGFSLLEFLHTNFAYKP